MRIRLVTTSVTKNSWKTPETVRIKDWISESVRSGHPSFEKRKYKGTNEGLKDPGRRGRRPEEH